MKNKNTLNIPGMSNVTTPQIEKEKTSKKSIPETKTRTVLDVLFPEEEVQISKDLIVVVRPLSLEDLPKISDAFGALMRYAMAGYDPVAIAAKAFGEIAKLIPYCTNVPPREIPASFGPEIMEIIVRQNVTEDVIKKWTALIEKVSEMSEVQDLLVPDQGLPKKENQQQKKA